MSVNALVVGGRLQGVEIAFLAKEAGWNVTLVDCRLEALAANLSDRIVCADAAQLNPAFLSGFDIVFPALEDLEVLIALEESCQAAGVPLAFDERAYRITSSKRATNEFLTGLGVSIPPDISSEPSWDGGYIVKPDSASGSSGVRRFADRAEALAFLATHPEYIGQAFLEGDVLSIEVICDDDDVVCYCITEVVVGGDFDCHRIVAPARIGEAVKREIRAVARVIGEGLHMRGIFDIELIMHEGVPYVLELDARMPSQTPIAAYFATGVNYVVETAARFMPGLKASPPSCHHEHGHVILQHVLAEGGTVSLIGEGSLAYGPSLVRVDGRFGADMALVGREQGPSTYATLVVVAGSPAEADRRMGRCLRAVAKEEAIA